MSNFKTNCLHLSSKICVLKFLSL